MLAQAYAADPDVKQAAALYEGLLAERVGSTSSKQRRPSSSRRSKIARARADVALMFGTRWVLRHQNVDIGARFLEERVKLDPKNEGAFFFLRDAYGKKGGDWDRVLTLAEEAVTQPAKTATPRSFSPKRARSRGGSSAT